MNAILQLIATLRITLFDLGRELYLTKDLTKLVHRPAWARHYLHLVANQDSHKTLYLPAKPTVSAFTITLYKLQGLLTWSTNDDAGPYAAHTLISLGETHFATGFAHTFAHMPAKSGQTNFQFITAYEKY